MNQVVVHICHPLAVCDITGLLDHVRAAPFLEMVTAALYVVSQSLLVAHLEIACYVPFHLPRYLILNVLVLHFANCPLDQLVLGLLSDCLLDFLWRKPRLVHYTLLIV